MIGRFVPNQLPVRLGLSLPRKISSAFIPMVVLIQVPSAVATRSVGENASPLPLLSVGASVATFACEGPWVASQWRSPVYLIEMLTMKQLCGAFVRGAIKPCLALVE